MVTFTPEEAATVRARVAVWVREPEVPVKTTLALPACALLPAVSVTLCGVPGVSETDAGLAVTPAGNPLKRNAGGPGETVQRSRRQLHWLSRRPPMVRLSDWGLRPAKSQLVRREERSR